MLSDWSMETVYLACAGAGGTVLVVQTLLLLFGHGDGGDAGVHVDHVEMGQADSGEVHSSDTGFGLVSVRTIAAFLAFFGLAGWGATRSGWSTLPTIGVALAAGLAMLFAVAALFRMQRRLASSGNLDPANAVGRTATVYLKIPGANAGKGRIQVAVQGRTAELVAFTNAPRDLATGSEVRVVRQVTSDTFEVEPL